MMPSVPFGIPLFVLMFFQVSPPSVDFQSAEPSPPLSRLYGVRRTRHVDAKRMRGFVGSIARSPPPAYTTFGSPSDTATAPIEPPKKPSETFFHVSPPSSVFHTPPPVPPK